MEITSNAIQIVQKFGQAFELITEAAKAFNSLASLPSISKKKVELISGLTVYESNGSPFGKSVRGYKKWRKREFGF